MSLKKTASLLEANLYTNLSIEVVLRTLVQRWPLQRGAERERDRGGVVLSLSLNKRCGEC